METKVEIELAVQFWYGRVMREAEKPTGNRADPRCDNGHRIGRGEDYLVLVRSGGKSGATLCIKECRDKIFAHLQALAEASGKLGHPKKAAGSPAGRRTPASSSRSMR